MTTTLAPTPVFKGWDNNGNPLIGGQLFTYAAGTAVPLATYTDSTGVTANSNPVILNARGEAQVWLIPNTGYKFVLQDAFGNQLWAVDQIISSQLLTLFGGVDTGGANAYLLNFTSNFQTLTNGIVVYWIPANTNTGGSTLNVNGLATINIVNPSGGALVAGQIVAGEPVGVVYYNGSWVLLVPTGSVLLGQAGANAIQGWGTTAAAYVDMSPDKGSWNAVFSGPWVTANNPTSVLNWERQGTQVTVWSVNNVTQTSTGGGVITVSGLPAAITPSSPRLVLSACLDVGSRSITNALGCVSINTNNTLTIAPVFTANASNPTVLNCAGIFDNSGIAGIDVGWSITYSL